VVAYCESHRRPLACRGYARYGDAPGQHALLPLRGQLLQLPSPRAGSLVLPFFFYACLLLLYTGILKQAARSLELLGREIGAWHVGGTPQLCIETRWCCSFPTQIGSNSPQPKSSPLPSD